MYWKSVWRCAIILKNILFSLVYFIVTIQNIIHMMYKIGVNLLFMLLVWHPDTCRLLVVLRVENYTWVFDIQGVNTEHLCCSRVNCTILFIDIVTCLLMDISTHFYWVYLSAWNYLIIVSSYIYFCTCSQIFFQSDWANSVIQF